MTAWKEVRSKQQVKADEIYRRHMLETGLRGLRFAAQVNNQTRNDVMAKVSGRLMAKYWLKVRMGRRILAFLPSFFLSCTILLSKNVLVDC
jgi:hypothetical protein